MPGIIVGGGIVGLTTALMLHRSDIAVRVFEETPKIKELGVGRGVLMPGIRCRSIPFTWAGCRCS